LTGALEADRAADALEADSRITLAPPPPRRVKLTSSLPDEAAKSLALWSGKGSVKLDRLLELVSDAETAESAASAHLELCESAPASPRAWSVSFEAKGKERAEWIGPYLKDKRHPLMEGITLDGVIWSADPKHALSGVPIVSCGDQVLVSETRDGDKRLLRVKLDGGRSNLPRSPDWPIFLSNLVEARRAALPGPARTNLAAGEPFVFQAAGDAVYTVALDDRTSEVRARGALVYEDAARPGLYKVSRKSGDGAAEPVAEFAVNLFDASLSDARGLEPGARPAEAGPADSRARYSWVEAALVVAAMACVALDWFVLASGRRR
jgi:hypothetical protein